MDLISIIESAFLKGYATSTLTVTTMFLCVGFTACISLYVCIVYRMVNRNSFYDRNLEVALFSLSVITSMVILTIQSNIVVSLGMVGALSIVRFRTAIKSPMDLTFLFWSISIGIICGAGYAMIAVIGSAVLTIGILVFGVIPSEKDTMILVVNADEYIEESILKVLKKHTNMFNVRARNVSRHDVNLAIEVKARHPHKLLETITRLDHVTSASLVEHDGDVTA